MDQDYTLNLVIRALDEFSKTFATLNTNLQKVEAAQKKTATGTELATQGLNKFRGVMQQIMQGNFAGAFQSIAAALGPVGVAAGAAVGVFALLFGALNKQVEAVRMNINAVDDLADRYQMAMNKTNQLYNMSKIFNVSVDALGRTFKTMARQGLDPSIEGLLQVKDRLDAIDNPAKRTTEAYRMLGRGAMLLADMLATSNEELRIWADRAKYLNSVTSGMTDEQDKFNRTMEYYAAAAANARVETLGSTLSLKEQVQMTLRAQMVEHQYRTAIERKLPFLEMLTDAYGVQSMDIDELTKMLYVLQQLEAAGLPITKGNVDAYYASEDAVKRTNAAIRDMSDAYLIANGYVRDFAIIDSRVPQEWEIARAQEFVDKLNGMYSAYQDIIGTLDQKPEFIKPADVAQASWLANNGLPAIKAQIEGVQQQAATGVISEEAAANAVANLQTVEAALLVMSGEPMNVVASSLSAALVQPTQTSVDAINSYITKLTGLDGKQVDTYITQHINQSLTGPGSAYFESEKDRGNEEGGGRFGLVRALANGAGGVRRGVYSVGEAGEEGLVIANGRVQVIPHWKWIGSRWKGGRMAFGDDSGMGGNYVGDELIRAQVYSRQAGEYLGTGGRRIRGRGGPGPMGADALSHDPRLGYGYQGAAAAAAIASSAAQQAAAAMAQVIAAVSPAPAALQAAVTIPVIEAASMTSREAARTNEKMDQLIALLRNQATNSGVSRGMKEATQFMGQ